MSVLNWIRFNLHDFYRIFPFSMEELLAIALGMTIILFVFPHFPENDSQIRFPARTDGRAACSSTLLFLLLTPAILGSAGSFMDLRNHAANSNRSADADFIQIRWNAFARNGGCLADRVGRLSYRRCRLRPRSLPPRPQNAKIHPAKTHSPAPKHSPNECAS